MPQRMILDTGQHFSKGCQLSKREREGEMQRNDKDQARRRERERGKDRLRLAAYEAAKSTSWVPHLD